ncbi:MAG TPA: bifunctional nicotinamide-nucleotide adenylyltransferase/Nudix hydroxylase [Methanosarcina sp.]|nr:bifunctional nicotinamide-nucleotide adenylyltransferase/Nudix hydroxylase [Methanosarcina sp.]
MKKYDTVVFIGRLQPLHNGHVSILRQAVYSANKRVIVLIGSVNGPRTFKNPFTFEQRKNLVCSIMDFGFFGHPIIEYSVNPIRDVRYNDNVWIESVQETVNSLSSNGESVAIIGYKKDRSSKYLEWFPQWDFIGVEEDKEAAMIDATTVRNILFEGLNPDFVKGVLPNASFNFLKEFMQTPEYNRIRDEYNVVKAYRKSWESAPYAPTFICTDAVVICAGHVLMIERGAHPGKGQWALPGGFLDPNEKIRDCAIRELIEETQIDIPRRVLEGSIVRNEYFDHPGRSLRGRTVTHAFRLDVQLDPKGKLPKVKGGDDAAKAKWIPLGDLNEDLIYEDHYSIIQTMIGGAL